MKGNEVQTCTCPSGDGSLRWPCPAHPPEAQAQGGGEAVYGLFRAIVDAGGPETIAWHGVERGSREWTAKVRAGLLAIERQFHPERFDEPAPSAPVASEHVRRLVGHLAQWVLCMSHNESYFGEAAGHLKSTVEELVRSVDPIYPPKPSPSDSLAGVEIHTATVPFMPAQLPTTTAPPSAPVGVEGFDKWFDEYTKNNYTDEMLAEAAWKAALAQQPAACPRCGGTGEADSGGIHPWGSPAMIRCECQQPAASMRCDDCHEPTGPRAVCETCAGIRCDAVSQQPAAVDGAAVDRVAAALFEEATGEPWTVAGVEHEGPDRDYYRKLARKVLALATQPGGAE